MRKESYKFRILVLAGFSLAGLHSSLNAQEKYGNTLNLGIGIGGNYGYYQYAGNPIPVLHIDYEIDAATNFTLAPFIHAHTFTRTLSWGNSNNPDRNYRYRESALGIGVKGTYYFDKILKAGSKWDFYLAGSLGYVRTFSRWESGYEGNRNHYESPGPLYLDLHIGAEYRIGRRTGVFMDFSTGISTIGLAVHGLE
jgi:hypothetical protein